jgi:hypothetical protein
VTPDDSEIEATILRLVAERGADKTICPSEVARALVAPGTPQDLWSRLMQPVRRAAVRLAERGAIAILRKGKPVADLETFKGVYRLGLPRD